MKHRVHAAVHATASHALVRMASCVEAAVSVWRNVERCVHACHLARGLTLAPKPCAISCVHPRRKRPTRRTVGFGIGSIGRLRLGARAALRAWAIECNRARSDRCAVVDAAADTLEDLIGARGNAERGGEGGDTEEGRVGEGLVQQRPCKHLGGDEEGVRGRGEDR